MKHIKTFQDFVNESHLNEINRRLLGRKESKAKLPFFFQIFARDKNSDETHRVSVTGKDDYNEIKRQVEKDYPRSKYYYVIYQNVRGGFRNIGTNESEEITEEIFSQLMEGNRSPEEYLKNIKTTSFPPKWSLKDIVDHYDDWIVKYLEGNGVIESSAAISEGVNENKSSKDIVKIIAKYFNDSNLFDETAVDDFEGIAEELIEYLKKNQVKLS